MELPHLGQSDGEARRVRLTPRESEVLELASLGWTNARVAFELGVSVHAVKFHLASIFRKLGVKNRTEAAVALTRSLPERDGSA